MKDLCEQLGVDVVVKHLDLRQALRTKSQPLQFSNMLGKLGMKPCFMMAQGIGLQRKLPLGTPRMIKLKRC